MLEEPTLPAGFVYALTSAARDIEGAAEFAIRFRRVVAVQGSAGSGKTTALVHIAENRERTVYGAAREFSTPQTFYRFMASQFRLNVRNERSNQSYSEIINAYMTDIADRGYLLLIDEFQELDTYSLREVVEYGEKFRLPIVLAGNETSLRKRRGLDQDKWDQISTRIAKRTVLRATTADDFRQVAAAQGINNERVLAAISAYGSRLTFRAVRDLIEVASQMAGSTTDIALSHMEAAAILLSDDADSVKQLRPLKAA